MKLYVHVEARGDGGALRTWATRITLSPALSTVDAVVRTCCAAYARKFGSDVSPANVDVLTERNQDSSTRQLLAHDTRARKQLARGSRHAEAAASNGTSQCEDGDAAASCDFELVLVQRESVVIAPPLETPAPASTSAPAIARSPPPQHVSHKHKSDIAETTRPHAMQADSTLLDLGAQLMRERKYRAAAQLFETLVLPADPLNARALVAMGDIHAANDRFDIAVDRWYRKCWDHHHTSSSPSDEQRALLVLETGIKIARCEVQRSRFQDALAMIERLQELLWRATKSSGSGVFAALSSAETDAAETRMDVIKAEALYALHRSSPARQDAAIALLTHLLPDLQDPSVNLDALLLYAQVASDRGKRSEALSMVLRVLVGRPDDKAVRRQLAALLSDRSGMEMLRLAVPPDGPSAAAAYAFIGTILKDHGALESSVTCFERALTGNAACPAYALNHAHVLEVCNEYERAYNVLHAFFRRHPTLTVAGSLTAETVAHALDAHGWRSPSDGDAVEQMDERWRVEWVAGDPGHAVVYLDGAIVHAYAATSASKRAQTALTESDELDLLACFFTVVKILFVTGRVAGLPRLISLIEPVRTGRALHRTSIRNEQAYYSCVAQLLSVPDRFVPAASTDVPRTDVYVCGDSHTLATAWRHVCVRDERVLLRPALVTGLKHWHLRRDAVFYPKANFWHVLRAIPLRARVVFLFGEIDCREGILLAVERCKYETIEEGMAATIEIFMDALRVAVEQFAFEVFIHPVVPVLPETRALVVAYNRLFEQRVRASALCTWLDCFDDLLVPSASPAQLRPEFALDGTHLHPRYLCALERALSASLAGRSKMSRASVETPLVAPQSQ